MKNAILFCLLLLAQITTDANAQGLLQPTNLHDSVPYQGDTLLVNPMPMSIHNNNQAYIDCDWVALLSMIRDLEERIATALEVDTVYDVYMSGQVVGSSVYMHYDCMVLRDSIISLQIELDEALLGPPSVLSQEVLSIAQNVATIKAKITDDGGAPVRLWGVLFGKHTWWNDTLGFFDSDSLDIGSLTDYTTILDSTLATRWDALDADWDTYIAGDPLPEAAVMDTATLSIDSIFVMAIQGLERYTQYIAVPIAANDSLFSELHQPSNFERSELNVGPFGWYGMGDTLMFRTLPDPPTGLTLDTSYVTSGSALLKLSIADAGGQGPDEVTFYYDTLDFTTNTAVIDSLTSDSTGGTEHTVSLTGLTRYTDYYFNAFAENLAGDVGADANMTFKTLPDIPSGFTLNTDSVTSNSALLKLGISDTGGQGPDDVTFYYDTLDFTSYSAVLDSLTSDSTGGGEHTVSLTGLTRYTSYFFNAIAENIAGAAGPDINASFTTLPDVPTGLTLDTSYVTSSSALLKLNIADAGGQGPDEVTFYYDTLDFTTNTAVIDSLTSDSTGGTEHTVSLTGLTRYTDYYFNAFAENLAGDVGAAANMTFKTPPELPTFDTVYFDASIDSLVAMLSDDGGQVPTAKQFRIDTEATLASAVDTVAALSGDAFKVLYAGEPGSTYHGFASATNLAGTTQSDTIMWSTLVDATTNAFAENITDSTGTIQASFAYGNAVPTTVGFQWGLAADLSDANQSIITLAADSTIELALTGLTKYNTYYFSSFATNDGGTANGDTMNFMARTLVCESPNFDGYDYDVVALGNQCWFAENLRSDNYKDGTAIPGGLNDAAWASATSGAQAVYAADSVTYLADYGRVYNFHAVNTGLLCPVGWHVPTQDEFTELSSYLGGTAVAGLAMKSSGADVPSWNGTNSSGFAALPGSFRHEDGTFLSAGMGGYWWSSSDSATYARYWNLNTQTSTTPIAVDNTLYSGLFDQVTGNSVRCIRDEDSAPVVTTVQVEATNATTANLQGSVAFNWAPIAASGFKWGYHADLSDGVEVTGDTLIGDLSLALTGLAPETAVYYVAFATNDLGTTYGDTLAFNTKVQLNDANIGNAAEAWCADSLSATSTYGHISDWEMGAVTNINRIFKNQPEFNSDISQWDVSAVTTAFETFSGATAFDQNLSNWDVSSLQNMGGMFNDASSFSSDLSTWDVSSVTNMKTAFKGCTALGTDFSGWDVSSVKNISYMFNGAANFSSDLSAWDVSSVTDMKQTFANASSFQSDLSTWDVGNVTNMELMFSSAELFNADLNGWNVSSVNNMRWMFSEALNFNGPISNWDVGSVTDMEFMFQSASSFDQALNTWDVSSVNTMQSMFSGASSFNQDLSGWDVASVTNMSDMFKLASTFDQELNNWNVGQVETMKGMFHSATAFNRNLSGWDVSSVTNMQSMFSSATSFDQNLNTWDVSGVENMSFMFNSANSFNGDVSSWNVSNVNNMAALFKGASAFNGDVSAWDVSSVTIFRDMFNMAIAFNSAVSPWNVSSGGTMDSMFKNATAFNQSVSDWDVSSVTNMNDLFEGAVAFNQDLSSWNVAAVTAMNGLISGTNFSQTNYDALLMAWSALPLQSNVSLYAMDRSYCYGAAARQSIIDDYGWTISGDTPCSPLPSATAEAATNVGLNGADLNGSFAGMSVVTEAGFMYGTDSTLAGALPQAAGTTSPFTLSLSGLAPNTKYYYRAYVTDEIATIEGLTTESFQTFGLPEVTTVLDSTWTDSTATLIGWVDPDVIPAATVTGFKWGALADLSDATEVVGDALTDTFRYALTASGPLYYTAYATNAVGTVYGDTVQLVDNPVLNTLIASNVGDTSVTLNASLFTGRRAVSATGFKWGYQSDLSDGTAVAGDALLGDFSADLSGLIEGQTLYFSAFMTNDAGTLYGDTLSKCLILCEPAEFDGYTYETVTIGCQCWFAENLRSDNYSDGSPIQGGLDDAAWAANTEGAEAIYDGDSVTYFADYGRLYNWYAVDNAAGLCPSGWHVPSHDEWTALEEELGGQSVAGATMKSSATDTPAWNGTNTSGFSALPGGRRANGGSFSLAGSFGTWWSSSPSGSNAWQQTIQNDFAVLSRSVDFPLRGFSVRCLRSAASAPFVRTTEASEVTNTTATLNGSVDFSGWRDVTATGFKWGYASDLSDGIELAGDTLSGDFSADLTGLITDDTLYVVAFATNSIGTAYGDTMSFEVSSPACEDLTSYSFDGYDYRVVSIGDQCWFAENLRSTNYDDGSPIPGNLDDATWASTTSGAQSIYDNDSLTNYSDKGRLYNWYAVEDARGLCPAGWHVPTDAEWTELLDGQDASLVGSALKSSADDTPPWDGSNSSGFSGIPGGYRSNTEFVNGTSMAYLWSSTSSGTDAIFRRLSENNEYVSSLDMPLYGGLSVRCLRDTASAPQVATAPAVDVTDLAATLKGDVDFNWSAITATGFEWGYETDLSDGAVVTADSLTGEFSAELSGLVTGDTVYFAAFATNALGTTYGDTLSFEAKAPPCRYLSSVNFDGHDYSIVEIGDQCWFAENLRTTVFSNGDNIDDGLSNSAWSNSTSSARTVYGEGGSSAAANLSRYGRLYNWYAVADERGICPEGWHAPSNEEWTILVDGYGGTASAGNELKAASTDSPAWDGNNLSGFTALPGGYRNDNDGLFNQEGNRAYMWTTSEAGGQGKRWRIDGGSDALVPADNPKQNGFSVRCLMDTASAPAVVTLPATQVAASSGTLVGSVTFNWSPISATGFKWSQSPDLSNATDVAGDTLVSTFESPLSGLSLGDEIYFAAYATNALGTTFGDTLSFITTSCVSPEMDGYTYSVVEVADQCWLAENLRTTTYLNGDPIPSNLSNSAWSSTNSGAVTVYGQGTSSAESNLSTYGRLYNHYAVTDSRDICPVNWHTPTNAEWTTLVNTFGGTSSASNELKASSADSPGWDGNNLSGFTVLPGGYRNNDNGGFDRENERAYMWTSSTSGSLGKRWRLDQNSDALVPSDNGRRNGFSVRCIQDAATLPVVTTSASSSGTSTSVTLHGQVAINTSENSATGFKWWNFNDPSSVFTVSSDTLLGSFSARIDGLLTAGTRIYFTAFATNGLGTSYGDTLSYTPQSTLCTSPTFDGYTYEVWTIGSQCWFAENLRSDNYADGSAIPGGYDEATWDALTVGAQAIYNGDSATYFADYGRLYNWYAVGNTAGLCPSGWHVPSDAEFTALTDFLGGESIVAEEMKSSVTDTPSWDGTNLSGWSGEPSGGRGTSGFAGAGNSGSWWTSTQDDSNNSWTRTLQSVNSYVTRFAFGQENGISVRCLQGGPSAPTPITAAASSVITEAAILNGSVAFDGYFPVTATGFTWGYQPDLSDGTEVAGNSLTGSFSADLTGLNYNSTIYFSAFATNALGTAYGDTLSRCLMQCNPVEFDGYTYETVAIGCECWFAENLRSDNYADGSPIPGGLDDASWFATTQGAQAIYNADSASYFEDFGRLYNWSAVENSAGLCPTGWHVPTDTEFSELSNFLGLSLAGEKMKSSATDTPPWDGTNLSGWSGLPGARRTPSGSFLGMGDEGYWWTSSPNGSTAKNRTLLSSSPNLMATEDNVIGGNSVRCLRDDTSVPTSVTAAGSQVTRDAATLNGSVAFDGYSSVTATGFKWGYQPDLSDGTVVAGNALTGGFSADLTGLAENGTIYFAAFASNAIGTSYSDTLSQCLTHCDPVEFDGYTYETTVVDCECWFAENLRSDNYADGSPIAGGLDNVTWEAATDGAQAIYDNDSLTYYADYGRLYNWYAVDSAAGLCPTGWHVPTDDEFTELAIYLGGVFVAGEKLRSSPTDSPSWTGTNEVGWSALPGGYRASTGLYWSAGVQFYVWSSSMNANSLPLARRIYGGGKFIYRETKTNQDGFSVRCLRDESSAPTPTTAAASAATTVTATLNGSVAFDGYSSVTATGFKWGYQPDLSDGTVVGGNALTGSFSADLTGLTENSTIYFSAFATNALGTAYGDTLSRCLMQCDPVEFDGYTYETVAIGCQCWFAENLRSDQYRDGSPIAGGLDNATWSGTTEGAQAIYNSDSAAYFADYGRLYNWYAVESTAGLCPTGWHVPTDNEWKTLEMGLGMTQGQADAIGFRGTDQGTQMKATSGWFSPGNGSNSSGFTGLPGGFRWPDGSFSFAGANGYWWSSSPSGSDAWFRFLSSDYSNVFRNDGNQRNGFSVRCLRDSD